MPVTSAAGSDRAVRWSYSIGIVLIGPLAMLRASHLLMPRLFQGEHDYDRGLHDPGLWAAFHAYLLFAGFVPALIGLAAGIKGLARRPSEIWAWVGVVSNAAFVLVAAQLYLLLLREGFFSFVLRALPRFVDV